MLQPTPELRSRLADPLVACALARGDAAHDTLVKTLQSHDIAVVLEDAETALRAGADGVHITLQDDEDMRPLTAAIAALKPDRIVGVGGLNSRHAAMTAGECDVDYVMFGEPDAHERTPSLDAVIERATWWAGIFNIPCVAHAPDPDAIEDLIATGCDFISLPLRDRNPEREPVDVLRTAIQILRTKGR